jgi:acyl-CoA synthetase (AMP-forming)/AMP-acid ligase II
VTRAFGTFVDVLGQRGADVATRDHGLVMLGQDGGEEARMSWRELEASARHIGAALSRRTAPGDRVILLFPSGLEFVQAFMGCLYAGCIAVPLFPPDLRNLDRTLPRLRKLVADASPSLALAPAENLTLLRAGALLLPELRRVSWLSPAACLKEAEDDTRPAPLAPPAPDAVAFLQYTSGSTSQPKGVMVTHRNLVANSEVIHQLAEHSPSSVYVSWLPIYHDMGLIGGVLQPLYMGGQGVIMSPFTFLRRPVRWLEAITRYRGTTSPFPNFALELCVKRVTDEEKPRLDLRSWKVACNGAEPVREDTLQRFSRSFAASGFDPRAHYPAYGLAESTLLVTGGRAGSGARTRWVCQEALAQDRVIEREAGAAGAVAVVGCGQAAAGHRVVIAVRNDGGGTESFRPAADDQVGEIWQSGPSVADGYWQNPTATAESFGARLEGGGDDDRGIAFLRTGDLGFLRDGELYVTGRLKDLIIIGGANYYPQDIERAAEGGARTVLRAGCAAAFCIPHEDQERLVVVAEVRKGQEAAAGAALRAVRQAIIDDIGLVPFRVVLIRPGELAKTSSGKTQRSLMRARFLEGQLRPLGHG